MKLAHIIQRTIPAHLTGSERHMYALSKALAHRGHKVNVLTSMAIDLGAFYSVRDGIKDVRIYKPVERLNSLTIIRFPIHYELRYLFRLFRDTGKRILKSKMMESFSELMLSGPLIPDIYFYILTQDYDVVHAMTFPYPHTYFAYKAAKRRGIPFVITPLFHYKFAEYYNPFLLEVLREADAVIALTNFERKLLLKLGAKRCYVVPPGIWVNEWRDVKGDDLREKLGLDDYFVVLIPSKRYEKGAAHVLISLILLRKSGIKVAAVAFGKPYSRDYYLWECAKRYAIARGVKVRDFNYVSEHLKKKLYATADVIAMVSIADAFGIAYLEAWACGKPVIGARTPVMAEVIRDGTDGFLVEYGNIKEIGKKLMLLAKDERLRISLSENGKQKVLHYDWNYVAKKMERIYQALINGEKYSI